MLTFLKANRSIFLQENASGWYPGGLCGFLYLLCLNCTSPFPCLKKTLILHVRPPMLAKDLIHFYLFD